MNYMDGIRKMSLEALKAKIEELSYADDAVAGTSLQCPANSWDNCTYGYLNTLRNELKRREDEKTKSTGNKPAGLAKRKRKV
jgi:hypothetical protein